MNDLDRRIRARIDAFVEELSELVRQAALAAVSEALGGAAKPRAEGRGKTPRPAKRAKGAKRSAGELESLSERVLEFVSENPGQGAQQIARELGLGTKDLVLPMKKLLATGSVVSKGQRRATKYFRTKR